VNASVNPVSRLRRNHGLEHATLHILSEKYPHLSLAGHSDLGGFWIVGDVDLEDLAGAVDEGLRRMQSGEHSLSVHPNCGTNYVATGILAGTAAWLATLGTGRGIREKTERLPLVIGLATLALVFGHPLGMSLQAHVTTSGYPDNLRVLRITASTRGKMHAYRVETSG
jgi:hypothetical protein